MYPGSILIVGKVKSLVDLPVAVRGELFPECLREVEDDDGEDK
jgi:hypothetical protein